jgi:hypothetical protein
MVVLEVHQVLLEHLVSALINHSLLVSKFQPECRQDIRYVNLADFGSAFILPTIFGRIMQDGVLIFHLLIHMRRNGTNDIARFCPHAIV